MITTRVEIVCIAQRVLPVGHIKVKTAVIAQDHIAAAGNMPLHILIPLGGPVLTDHRRVQIAGGQNLIPADQALTLLLYIFQHPVVEPALQLFHIV